jgi:hypothetical protein
MNIKFISKVGFTAMIGLAIVRSGGNGAEKRIGTGSNLRNTGIIES